MARKVEPKGSEGPQSQDWYLVEWMRALGVSQAKMAREIGVNKSTLNDIYHGRTLYYRELLNKCANALKIRPFELLLSPEEANDIRRNREVILRAVESSRDPERRGNVVDIR